MVLFINSSMDAFIVLAVAIAVFKFVFFSKRDNKNLSLIAVGAVFILIAAVLPSNSLGNALSQPGLFSPVLQALYIIGFVIILVGSIKLIFELLKAK